MYLLDTNIISELRKAEKGCCNLGVYNWAASADRRFFHTSTIVTMELERGILGLERKDPIQGKLLRNWVNNFIHQLPNPILNVDNQTAMICAKLHVPDRSPENDAWIAAQAIQKGLVIVTRNSKDFERFDVKLFNPFSE